MRYVSIDLETTGLDFRDDQVLQAALIVEDTDQAKDIAVEDLPTFACLVSHDRYVGDAYALGLNADILKAIATCENNEPDGAEIRGRRLPVYPGCGTYDPEYMNGWEEQACKFLDEQLGAGKMANAAGKNAAGFDLQFLKGSLKQRFRHRVIDPGSVFLKEALQLNRDCLLNLGGLKAALGLGSGVAHDAVEDARDVIRCLRKAYT